MKKNFQILEERTKEIEKEFGSVEEFARQTTKAGAKHRLKMRADSFDEMKEIYHDLEDLERADLEDYLEGYGKYD